MYRVLVSLALIGLVAGCSEPVAQQTDVTYTRATLYEDGTSLPLSEIAETRLYCNGALLVSEPGADERFEGAVGLMSPGDNVCYGTHVATNGEESQPSGTITIRVIPTARPNPPVLN